MAASLPVVYLQEPKHEHYFGFVHKKVDGFFESQTFGFLLLDDFVEIGSRASAFAVERILVEEQMRLASMTKT